MNFLDNYQDFKSKSSLEKAHILVKNIEDIATIIKDSMDAIKQGKVVGRRSSEMILEVTDVVRIICHFKAGVHTTESLEKNISDICDKLIFLNRTLKDVENRCSFWNINSVSAPNRASSCPPSFRGGDTIVKSGL